MFEPRVMCFFCKWCTYAGADLAGTSRKQYPPNGVAVRVNCSGRVDPQHILWAFREGADGVLLGGCHPGDCHYQDGNYNTMRRLSLLKPMLKELGINPDRVRLEWISAAEGDKLVRVMNEFVEQIRELGPMSVDLGEKLAGVDAPPDAADAASKLKPEASAPGAGSQGKKKASAKSKPKASAAKSKPGAAAAAPKRKPAASAAKRKKSTAKKK